MARLLIDPTPPTKGTNMRTKVTIKDATACHPLAGIVLAQLGGGRDAVESAIDAAHHGADGGFHGFIYHSDITPWVRRHKVAIRQALADMASDLGEDAISMIRGFRCLQGDATADEIGSVLYGDGSDAGDMAGMIYSALAWFALEDVGRAITDLAER